MLSAEKTKLTKNRNKLAWWAVGVSLLVVYFVVGAMFIITG